MSSLASIVIAVQTTALSELDVLKETTNAWHFVVRSFHRTGEVAGGLSTKLN
jgi:hypothetical protein